MQQPAVLSQPAHRTTPSRFDPAQIARCERAGWEAYYARDWLRAFRLMVSLNRAQFGMSWSAAGAGAVDIVRASRAFAPMDNHLPAAHRHLASFYARARRTAGFHADAATLADLELEYWIVHRQLAVRRLADPADDDTEPMVAALANLHAALFDATPAAMRRSAERRAMAARTVDGITGHYSTDVPGDWQRVETLLRWAYQAVLTAT